MKRYWKFFVMHNCKIRFLSGENVACAVRVSLLVVLIVLVLTVAVRRLIAYQSNQEGWRSLEENEYVSAEQEFRRAIWADPLCVSAYQGLGFSLFAVNAPGKGAKQFDHMSTFCGSSLPLPPAIAVQAVVLQMMAEGRMEDIDASLKKIPLHRMNDSGLLQVKTMLVLWHPDSNMMPYQEGMIYAVLGHIDRAKELIEEQARREFPEDFAFFPLEVVDPDSSVILGRICAIVPDLVRLGLWDLEFAKQIVSLWVWKYYKKPSVEWLLETLSEEHDGDASWLLFLAELYHRRGMFGDAESSCLKALEKDPAAVDAFLLLGDVAASRFDHEKDNSEELVESAIEWYWKYHKARPDDVACVKRLMTLVDEYDRMGCDAGEEFSDLLEDLRELISLRIDNRRFVAELFSVEPKSILVGSNLVTNGQVDGWKLSKPRAWKVTDEADGRYGAKGVIASGMDRFYGWTGRFCRSDRLWLLQGEGYNPGSFAFWHEPLVPDEGRYYLITLTYRTIGSKDGNGRLWLSNRKEDIVSGYAMLPDTKGLWRRFMIVGRRNFKAKDPKIELSIMHWGVGRFDWDDVRVRTVDSVDGLPLPDIETRCVLR